MQNAKKVEASAEVLEAQWCLDDVGRDGRMAGNGMGVSEDHVSTCFCMLRRVYEDVRSFSWTFKGFYS